MYELINVDAADADDYSDLIGRTAPLRECKGGKSFYFDGLVLMFAEVEEKDGKKIIRSCGDTFEFMPVAA